MFALAEEPQPPWSRAFTGLPKPFSSGTVRLRLEIRTPRRAGADVRAGRLVAREGDAGRDDEAAVVVAGRPERGAVAGTETGAEAGAGGADDVTGDSGA